MQIKKPIIKQLLSILVCMSVLFSTTSPFAQMNQEQVTVVFAGNTTVKNPQVTPYSEQVGEYIETKYADKDVTIKNAGTVDIDSDTYLSVVKEQVMRFNPDIVFLEIDISAKRKGTESDVLERMESIVRLLLSSQKRPRICFVYTPEETFLDYRAPFDKIVDYYQIPVCDVFRYLKQQYTDGQLRTKDFLTAGLIPSEQGHTHFAKAIVNELKRLNEPELSPTDLPKDSLTKAMLPDENKSIGAEGASIPQEGQTIYVAVNGGDDGAKGTVEEPLKTIQEAQRRVRALKKEQGGQFGGATVYLREGLYTVSDSFVLSEEDSGAEYARVVYSGYPGETIRFTNAHKLNPERFEPVREPERKRIPKEAQGFVLEYDLKKNGISQVGTFMTGNLQYYGNDRFNGIGNILVADSKREQRAQYPNGGFANTAKNQLSDAGVKQIFYQEDKGNQWETADNAWVKGILGQGYHTDLIKVVSFDSKNKIINLVRGGAYGIKPGWLWSLVNVMEELDIPGEWYVDEKKGVLYYYPRKDIMQTEILFSPQTKPIFTLNGTKYITISNITFEGGCGTAIEIVDGYANIVDGCIIRNMGYSGVNITCTDKIGPGRNGVINSHIYNTGATAIYLRGGDRKTLVAGEDYVDNCLIENFAMDLHGNTGGIMSDGTVGASVRHCNIHNDNSSGLYMGGNDDLYEYNEIYNVIKNTDDYGAVYGDHRGAMRQGAIYRYNYMHDVVYESEVGTTSFIAGFYTDANRNNGARVLNNVFYNVQTPVFFANNQNMVAKQNLFLDTLDYPIRLYKSVYGDQKVEALNKQLKTVVQNGTMFKFTSESQFFDPLLYRAYLSTPEFTKETEKNYYLKYPWLEMYLETVPFESRFNTVENNAIFHSQRGILMPKGVEDYNVQKNNYITNDTVDPKLDIYERFQEGMRIAKQQVGEFEQWNVQKAGIKEKNNPIGSFDVIAPVDNAKEQDVKSLVLCWDYAVGADKYRVLIATDENFENIVFDKTSYNNYLKVSGLKYGGLKYYWKVIATPLSTAFAGEKENANGVRCFYSAKTTKVDKEELEKEIKSAQEVFLTIVEGDLPGQYPQGVKQTLQDAIDSANQIFNNHYIKQSLVDDMKENLYTTVQSCLSKAKWGEIDFSKQYAQPANVYYAPFGGQRVSGEESQSVTKEVDGLSFKGSGSVYSKEQVNAYDIVRMKAKFDFGGNDSGSIYSMFGLRVQGTPAYMYAASSYVFLVTKSAIELQGFKVPGGVGKFYMTVPNNFIREGEECDIEFCALPVNDGSAVRIILRVDGQIVYDYTDSKNIITKGGYAGVSSSNAVCSITISPAQDTGAYPTLLELLQDPKSELNKND